MFADFTIYALLRKICVIGILTLYVMLCEVSHVLKDLQKNELYMHYTSLFPHSDRLNHQACLTSYQSICQLPIFILLQTSSGNKNPENMQNIIILLKLIITQ